MAGKYKKHIEASFEALIEAMGGRVAKDPFDHGAYKLSHNSQYGGWTIRQICEDSTGEDTPFGTERLPSREFSQALYFARCALDILPKHPIGGK
jgi:hypothetical protein